MYCSQDRRISDQLHHSPAFLRHAKFRAEQGLACSRSQANDEFRSNRLDLSIQPRAAGGYLSHRGFLMDAPLAAGLPLKMLYGIGDIGDLTVNSRFRHALVEQLPGGSDEWLSRKIFLIAWLFPDEQDLRRRAAVAEYSLGRVAIKLATAAVLCRCPQRIEIPIFWKKVQCRSSLCLRSHIWFDAIGPNQ